MRTNDCSFRHKFEIRTQELKKINHGTFSERNYKKSLVCIFFLCENLQLGQERKVRKTNTVQNVFKIILNLHGCGTFMDFWAKTSSHPGFSADLDFYV